MGSYLINIELNSYLRWPKLLSKLPKRSLLREGDEVELNLNYKCGSFVDDCIFPILCSYWYDLKRRGIHTYSSIDTTDNCTYHYAGRMGLYNHLDIVYNNPYNANDPMGKFIPITNIDETGTYALDPKFSQKLSEDLELSDGISDAFKFAIGEMIANINMAITTVLVT